MENEFKRLIKPIVSTEKYKSQANFIHHGKINTMHHSINVAYLSYKFAKKHKSNVDINSLVRAALLHDYYLYDWHKKEKWHKYHGFKHPYFALKNALIDYPNLNKQERNAILRHMWPLTLIPPRYKIGWIITYCDKLATWNDYINKKKKKKNLF